MTTTYVSPRKLCIYTISTLAPKIEILALHNQKLKLNKSQKVPSADYRFEYEVEIA
jgi:hypothetical protein